MNPLAQAYYLLRYFGPRIISQRATTYLTKATGSTRRRYAERPWASIKLREIAQDGTPTDNAAYAGFKRDHAPPFLFPLGDPPAVPGYIRKSATGRTPDLAERLRLIADNRCVYFFRTPSPEAIDWHVNPFERGRTDGEADAFDLPTFLSLQGDPRTLWEPARAAWAIDLARAPAYGYTGDAGALYWQWVDSFMEACPPFKSYQWKSGQESAVRFIAVALGFWSLAKTHATTPKRWLQFARLAWATGYRIYHQIGYALSQKNNHAIMEACGLMVIAHLFPELDDAARWRLRGRQVIESEVRGQVYPDGVYLQQSMNYHRVMLQGTMLALRIAELEGDPLPRETYDHLARGADFLFEMMDPVTGFLPNYGYNDGAWVLPLSECDFRDYRPTVQAVNYLCRRRRMIPAGPWDEDMLWLFGREAVMTEDVPPRIPRSAAFESGGYYTLRRGESWAMIRCHTYRDRVGHLDGLHVDLWWRGLNVLQDCGSYRYYIPQNPAMEQYFKGPAGQNTIEIDRRPALEAVSRFLWLPWTRARVIERQMTGDGPQWITGELYDYDRRPWKVLHRRTLLTLDATTWIIVDDVIGNRAHDAVLRWHLLDAPYKTVGSGELHLTTPKGEVYLSVQMPFATPQRQQVTRARADGQSVQGFAAPYYGELQPAPTLEVEYQGPLQVRFVTTVGLGHRVRVQAPAAEGDEQLWVFSTGQGPLSVRLAGPFRPIRRVVLGCASLAAGGSPRTHQTTRGAS